MAGVCVAHPRFGAFVCVFNSSFSRSQWDLVLVVKG